MPMRHGYCINTVKVCQCWTGRDRNGGYDFRAPCRRSRDAQRRRFDTVCVFIKWIHLAPVREKAKIGVAAEVYTPRVPGKTERGYARNVGCLSFLTEPKNAERMLFISIIPQCVF